MAYKYSFLGVDQLSRRVHKVEKVAGASALPGGDVNMSEFAEALGHELNNPLTVVMLEVGGLESCGNVPPLLHLGLSRLQAAVAELSLVSILKGHEADWLTLRQAMSLVVRALGAWGSRIDAELPEVVICLEALTVCHVLHAVLVAHLGGDAESRVNVSGELRRRELTLTISGGTRSGRLRASPLSVLFAQPQLTAEPAQLAVSIAHAAGLSCVLADTATACTRLILRCSAVSTVVPRCLLR